MLYKETLVDSDYTHVIRHDINNVTFGGRFNEKEKFIINDYAPYVFKSIRRIIGIEAEENARGLTPVGPVPMGIQKPQVQHHVLTIVGGELLALRRFIKELRCRLVHHRPPRCSRCFCDFPSALALIQDSGSQIFSGPNAVFPKVARR